MMGDGKRNGSKHAPESNGHGIRCLGERMTVDGKNSAGRASMDSPETGRILLVDDFPYDRDLLLEGLVSRGHNVVACESGEEALDVLAEQNFELILLDSKMPGMDGLDVLREIRLTHSRLHLPVIMVTGLDQAPAIVEALRDGANDYVTKPVDLDVIAARISSQLSILRLRESIQREQEFSESLIESANDMIVATDLDGRITIFNPMAERVFGYPRNAIQATRVEVLFADPAESLTLYRHTLQQDGFSGEVSLRRCNGDQFIAQLSASVQRDKTGEPVGIIIISRDLTEILNLQAERARLLKTKEEFFAMASHDLKSPISTILGFAWLLEQELQPDQQIDKENYHFIKLIRQNAARTQKIIQDFLNFHALEESKLTLKPAVTNLARVVEEVVESCRDLALQKEIELRATCCDARVDAYVDGERIEQVVRNLVDNAIKFCPRRSRVDVTLECDPAAQFRISVCDSGPGLTEQDMAMVFGKYNRLSNKPTGGEKSSGLGLYLCKQMVELHGGEIGVFNNPDVGATFWFTIQNAQRVD